jgi:hypothetical protein
MEERKVAMTIEVERKDSERLNILELKLFHRECGGGSVKISRGYGYDFKCKRCDVSYSMRRSDTNKVGLANVAVKGTEYVTSILAFGHNFGREFKFIPR